MAMISVQNNPPCWNGNDPPRLNGEWESSLSWYGSGNDPPTLVEWEWDTIHPVGMGMIDHLVEWGMGMIHPGGMGMGHDTVECRNVEMRTGLIVMHKRKLTPPSPPPPPQSRNMVLALKELSIRGDFRTTVEYLITLLETESFLRNQIDTAWLDRLIAEKVKELLM